MKDLIKVRIDKSNGPEYWYTTQIGAIVFVKDFVGDKYILAENDDEENYRIDKLDCTVIQDDLENQEKDTYQPDEWVVWSGVKPVVAQILKRVEDDCFGNECYSLKTNDKHNSCYVQYIRKALPHEIPVSDSSKHEPKGWRIKVTHSNICQLSKFVKFKDGDCVLEVGDWVLSHPSDMMYFPMHETASTATFHKGFTELFTVEEFFEKVNYKPEPVIIAKAGEWVKIVDFGEAANDYCEFSYNKPYELREDLFIGGGFYPKKDDKGGITNGYSKYPAETMKFEKVTAPIEQKEEIEHIEKSIDKATVDRLELVLRMCNIQIHKDIIDKIIDCVELIEDKGEKVSLMDVCKIQAEWKQSKLKDK